MTNILTAPINNNVTILSEATAKRASVIAERTKSPVVGIAKAMLIDTLKEKLQNGIAHFIFVKKDGTLREAWGTTKRQLVDNHINGRGVSRENYACCAFFDCEKGNWRSFRWESLVQVL